MKREYIIGFSITILVLCILMSGCFRLKDASDDDDFPQGMGTHRFNIMDAQSTTQEEGAGFNTTDAFLKVEQTGGHPIDWNGHVIYCGVTGSDDRKELVILRIGNTTFDPETYHISETGQILILGVGTDGDFSNGDYVDINIYRANEKVYSKKSIRVV